MDRSELPWWHVAQRIRHITVIHVDLSPDEKRENDSLNWLSPGERERNDRYIRDQSKRQFSLCRAALRALLCRQLACQNHELSFGSSKYGKPFALVRGNPASISFNVSHSGEHGLIALTSKRLRIGIDVEDRKNTRINLDGGIQTVFAPNERAELARAHGRSKYQLFYDLWVMKEAVVKAMGVGVAKGFSQFELPPSLYRRKSKTGDLCITSSGGGTTAQPKTQWRLQNLGNPQYAATLAFELSIHY